jgi:hypothetical protein
MPALAELGVLLDEGGEDPGILRFSSPGQGWNEGT